MKRIIGIILLLVLANVVCAEEEWATSVQQTTDGGYILAGVSDDDVKRANDDDAWLMKTDSNGNKEWNTTFEGDRAYSVQQTTDGGYILAGETSYGCDGIWLAKTDSKGNKEWDKILEGGYWDVAHSVKQTTDGGYILAGGTFSLETDDWNIWLVKTYPNGNKEWDRTFVGENNNGWDKAYSVQQTSEGGYILVGYTCNGPRDSGDYDVWLIKTDSNGNKEWDKTFGGDGSDRGDSVQQTTDGGYIIAGGTKSYGVDDCDVWLLKTDSNGNRQWDKTFEGDGADSVQQTSDGGYIIIGSTSAPIDTGDLNAWFATMDALLIKTDSEGNEEWDKTFGGDNKDKARSVQQTTDSGYIIAGSTESYGVGDEDAWLVKTDSNGNKQWDKTFEISTDTATPATATTATTSQQNKTSNTTLIFGGAAILIFLVLLVGKSRRKEQETPRPTPPTTRPTPPPEPYAAQEAADRERKLREIGRLAELRIDASNRLKTAKSTLNKARQLGIDRSQLNDILAKAEQAYQKKNYPRTIDYLTNYFASIDQAEKNKKQLEQMQKNAWGQINSANFSLQKAEKLGITVQHAKELNIKAQSTFDANDYSSAITYANQSNDTAEKLIDESKPSISIELPLKMEYEAWKHRDLTVTNTGSAHAVAITITFLTALEVRDLGVIKRLDVGDQKTINVNIKPTEKGEVPVDYSVAFKDLMGKDYKIKDSFNLQIGTGAEVTEGRADYERKGISPHEFTTFRTVWDPSNKDFVWGAEKPDEYGELPQIKQWIEDKNPNIYWFLLKIVNRADYPVTEWNVTLYTEQALTITEVHLNEKPVHIVDERFDTNEYKKMCVASVSPALGMSIPAKSERMMYFKMDIGCEGALKKEFDVFGVVRLGKSPQIEVPIREKRFTYKCKQGDFRNMFYGSTGALASQVMESLQNSYNREIVQNFTNSFRLIREFEKYCGDRYAESEILVDKLEVIHSSLKAAEPITKDEILPLVEKNLDELRKLSKTVAPNVEIQKERGIRICEKLIELLHIAASKIK